MLKFRPDLKDYATTNGPHCDGSGIKFSSDVGADVQDMKYV